MKVLINRCHGGFGLSDEAVERYCELKGINIVRNADDDSLFGSSSWWVDGIEDDDHYFSSYSITDRTDPILHQVVEELGAEAASGRFADLVLVDVPDDVKWHIAEYDGAEHVAEDHRRWTGWE